MMPDRIKSVSTLLKEVISDIVRKEIKDPRVTSLVSIVDVQVSRDLRSARVFTSMLSSSPEDLEKAVDGLNSASSYIRRRVQDEVTLKRIPFFKFIPDTSIARGVRVSRLIDEVIENDSTAAAGIENGGGDDSEE